MASKYVALTLSFEREGDVWVGVCLELGTSTFADTLEECQSELQEFVEENLNLLEEVGERDRFFKKWGITLRSAPDTPEQFTIRGSENGDFWNKLFQGTNGSGSDAIFLRPRIFAIGGKGEAAGQPAGANG